MPNTAARISMAAVDQIRHKVQTVEDDESYFGVLSTGEKIAVALVLDRYDLVKSYGTMLQAVDRLGQDWLEAALYVQRNGWKGED